jgi:hypothetical protein
MKTVVGQKNLRVGFAVLAVILLGVLPFTLQSQEPVERHTGVPIDWSTRHIIATNQLSPRMADMAMQDPRVWIHWMQHTVLTPPDGEIPEFPISLNKKKHIRVDWAMPLGANGGMPIGESPAKYSFNTSGYSCANDFVVYTINATPGASQANILAFNNLYTGTASSSCPFGPQTPPTSDYKQPTFMWSYEAGTSASYLSPTLSLDGTKVAFVEAATHPTFDVLTWVSGQGTDATHPVVPGTGGSALVRLDYTNTTVTGCTANPATANSNSSPYIDYGNDVAYIGADNGELYRISGIFHGTPTVQYCITVKANGVLTSPVYDQVSNQVFISDGYSVYSFTPGASSFTASGSISVSSTSGTDPIVLSPVVDTTNGFVYVFGGTDSTNKFSIVSQMNLALTSQSVAHIGPTNTLFVLDGDFDNAYFTSGPKSGAGTLYACGTQANNAAKPSLYALSFQSPTGVMNTTPAMSDNRNINGASNPNGTCSPLLDFDDGTTDRLFVGTGSYNGTTGANLVTEWNVNTRIPSNTTTPNSTATNEWGGTSAFTIDNVSTAPQTTSIYFGTLRPTPVGQTLPCTVGNYCAVKLTQSGLQ